MTMQRINSPNKRALAVRYHLLAEQTTKKAVVLYSRICRCKRAQNIITVSVVCASGSFFYSSQCRHIELSLSNCKYRCSLSTYIVLYLLLHFIPLYRFSVYCLATLLLNRNADKSQVNKQKKNSKREHYTVLNYRTIIILLFRNFVADKHQKVNKICTQSCWSAEEVPLQCSGKRTNS